MSAETTGRAASSAGEAAACLDPTGEGLRGSCFRKPRPAADSRSSTRGDLFERLQFLAGLETNRFARRDRDFSPRARIPSDTGLARPHVENAEASKLDALAALQGTLHAFEDGFNGHLGLGLG